MAKQPEKQLDLPTPASATTTPSLPMQLHLGDRYTDEEGGWEIAMRPWTTHGGKLVHASVQKSGDPSTKRDKTWERMSGWRLGGPNVTLVPPKPSTNGQRRNVMRQRLAAFSIAMFLGLLGSVPCTEALPFVTVGDGWDGPGLGSANLTYYFGVPTPDLSLNLQHTALVAALDAWASIVAVTFKETSIAHQPRSIDFNFETNGVSSGFLAFGFFPSPPNPEPIGGDIFFNDNFQWEVGNALGFNAVDLTLLAAHEIGHALGLDHSTTPDALMRPFFSAADVFVGFHPDDVAGIRSLYAAVPEPSTLLLASVGLVSLVANLIRRSRTRSSG